MDDILDEFVNEKEQVFSDKEIFTQIWTQPREVLKYIHHNQYDKYFYILLILGGISSAISRASNKGLGDEMSLIAVLGMSILSGGLMGWLSYYIYAALISWTGRWLGGKGDTTSILRIIAYAIIPSVIAMLFLLPQIGLFGNEFFKTNGDILSGGIVSNIIIYGSLGIQFILGVFTIVFCVVGVSEVQEFDNGKAFLNLLLPVLIIIVPILMLVFMLRAF